MSHQHHDHCNPSLYFHLFVCIKLFLPVLNGCHIVCSCGTLLYTHSIHFFNCHKFHPKTHFHNRICNTDHLCISKIGIHAETLCSRSDVTTEPSGLAHCNPTSHPADVFLDLSPTYVDPPVLPFAKAANDVHILGLSLPPSGGDSTHMVHFHHYSPPVG